LPGKDPRFSYFEKAFSGEKRSERRAMKKRYMAMMAVVVVTLWAVIAQANLITNGSFENTAGFIANGDNTMNLLPASTTMTGWQVINGDVAWIGPTNPFGLTASNGTYFLDLTGYDTTAFGGVTQTIFLAAGQYQLTFDLGSSGTAPYNYGTPSGITATVGTDTQTFQSQSSDINVWTTFTLPFTVATSGLTTISLTGTLGSHYIGLDNVSVSSVPLPSTMLLLGSGLLGLGLLRRKWSLKK
jgi:hypothetical protein